MLVRRRIAALFLIASVFLLLLGLRLAYLQIVQANHLTSLALQQRLRPVPLLAERGVIYDRNKNVLAASMSFEAVYATPVEIEDPARTARVLAPYLDRDVAWLEERFTRRQAIVWLKLRLTREEANAVRALDLPGIGIQERPLRYYPNDELAAALLGFAGIDNQGLEGLERHYESVLKGQDGMIVRERDAGGRTIPGGIERRVEPTDGFDLVLTIDKVIQYIAERELERGVLEADADWGVFVALDPRTGEVLAMANYPSFNPNHYADYSSDLWRNKALTGFYEPGSTFKIFTAAAALETGAATPESEFVDPVTLQIGGGRVSCWRAGGHGHQTFVEAVENSCNPVFAMLADRMGGEAFHKYVTAFGFGQKTGLDFPGEALGLVPGPKGSVLTWANVGFGQGVSTTAIQMVTAAAAIANGGALMRPYLVKEILDGDGNVVRRTEPEIIRRPITRETALEMREILRSVVENGSGRQADVAGYRVAGKTGTAQIPSPTGGYLQGHKANMASFLAFAPADDPRIVGIVMLYRVGREPSYGGVWAAPVLGRIFEQALEHMGVPRAREEVDPDPRVKVPNVMNLERADAEEVLLAHGLKVVSEGVRGWVVDQTPPAGARVDPGAQVILTFYETSHSDHDEHVSVPDVIGRSMRDAATVLSQAGLTIEIEGTGYAVSQDPPKGSGLHWGDVVRVRFEPPN